MIERIEPRFVERVWGSTDLSPLYPHQERPIGEVWFDAGPLLVKFLFTTAPLSVQVHPGGATGKTEMWHILRAEPGSWIWLGFRGTPTREAVEAGLHDGSICDMLAKFHPSAGDTFFTPAGVVHALGPGLTLCEIQQNSDITYRLYDYGRDRPLHIEQCLAVATFQPHPGKQCAIGGTLVACEYFVTYYLEVSGVRELDGNAILIPIAGEATADGVALRVGEVFRTTGLVEVRAPAAATLLRTYVP